MISLIEENKITDHAYYVKKALLEFNRKKKTEEETLKELRRLANCLINLCETIEARSSVTYSPKS